jgi:hypothetical protein
MYVTWSNVASSLEKAKGLQVTDEQNLEPSYDPAYTYRFARGFFFLSRPV